MAGGPTMKAKSAEQARWIHRGAIAAAITGQHFTFIAEPPELRLAASHLLPAEINRAYGFIPANVFRSHIADSKIPASTKPNWGELEGALRATVEQSRLRLEASRWKPPAEKAISQPTD